MQAGSLAATPLEEVEPAGRVIGNEAAESEPAAVETAESEPAAEAEAALSLFKSGEQALRDRNAERALQLFRQAYALRDQLDPQTAQRLQDHLQLLSASPGMRPVVTQAQDAGRECDGKAANGDQATAPRSRSQAGSRPQDYGEGSEACLGDSGRSTADWSRRPASTATRRGKCCDSSALSKDDVDKYIMANQAQLELNEANKEVLTAVERRHRARVEIDTKLAKLVDDFNQLMDEKRYPEAEVLAKRPQEIDPLNPLVKQLIWQSKFTRRTVASYDVRDRKEQAFVDAMQNVDEAAVMPSDARSVSFSREVGRFDEQSPAS